MVEKIKTRHFLNVHNLVLTFVVVALGASKTVAQVERTTIEHAVRVLKNIDTDKTKEWAVTTLENASVNDTSAYAMNCLGLAYMAGVGVEADAAKAIKWLEKAGAQGYADAFHNLGMMYKYSKCGVRQDFEKAYRYFSIGADGESVSCMYDKGFMLYKGLGCSQDYSKAFECFQAAASYVHSPSLYMLGLCYRNGYGVGQDEAKASSYLNRSAALGYRDAIEELDRPYPENYLHEVYTGNEVGAYIPENMPDINPKVNDISLIAGKYNGFIVMYDWSGKYVLGEKPVTMSASIQGTEMAGMMVLGTDTIPFSAEITNDGRLQFKRGSLKLNERYASEGKVKYRMDNAILDIWNDKIQGRLNLYSLKQKEPERPMYFELHRNGTDETIHDDVYSRIVVAPNPFANDFKATFELLNDADTQIRIFNKYGMLIWQQDLGSLGKGCHEVVISPDIMSGTYVLNIKAGKQYLRAIIVKNGGVQ